MRTLSLLVVLGVSSVAHAQDYKARLSLSPDLAGVRQFCQKFGRFGKVIEAQYSSGSRKLLLCWVESGGKVEYLFGYSLNGGKWQLVVDYPETSGEAGAKVVVSPVDQAVLVLDRYGRTAKTYPAFGR